MTKGNLPQTIVKPSVAGIVAAAGKGAGPAPVHLWNPPYCGEIDMRIARDGTWFHEESPIGRAPLVRLFANILKAEEGRYFLVTPVEKVGIVVEDVPFVAVDFTVEGEGAAQAVTFVTNIGDAVTAGAGRPLRVVTAEGGEPAPYVLVRPGLEARIDRKSFYRLVEIGHVEGDAFGIRSGGAFFVLGSAADLS
jgi:uncharacterized protein